MFFNATMYKLCGASDKEFATFLTGDLVHGIFSKAQVGVCDRAVLSCACVLGVVRERLFQRVRL